MQDFVTFHHGGAKIAGRKLWYYTTQQISEHALKHGVEIDLDELMGRKKHKQKKALLERRGLLGMDVRIPR